MSALKRLWDRAIVTMGLGRGATAANGASPIQTVQVIFVTTGEIRDAVPLMQQYGFASQPHAGCDYAVVSLGDDPTKSIIVASNDQRYRLTLAEGEAGIHDDLGQAVHLKRSGINISDKWGNSIVTGESGVTITSCTGIVYVDNQIAGTEESGLGASFTGDVRTTGKMIAGYGTADQVDVQAHTHKYLPGSGSQTDTAAPTAGT